MNCKTETKSAANKKYYDDDNEFSFADSEEECKPVNWTRWVEECRRLEKVSGAATLAPKPAPSVVPKELSVNKITDGW